MESPFFRTCIKPGAHLISTIAAPNDALFAALAKAPRRGGRATTRTRKMMKNWVLGAILAAAAAGMYVAIFVKIGSG